MLDENASDPPLVQFDPALDDDRRVEHRPTSGDAPFALHEVFFSRTDDRGVMVGWPTLYLGSSRRFVGFARLAVGDVGGAVEEFRRAVHADRWFPPLRARSQAGLELALSVTR